MVAYAVAINTLNTGGKFLAWIFTGSSAMFSEAIHSLADTMNQVMIFDDKSMLTYRLLISFFRSYCTALLRLWRKTNRFLPVLPGHFGSWSLPIGEAAGLGASLWLRQHEIRQLPDQRRRYLLRRCRLELVSWVK